jgi:predicted anti-sigma-YlaC factor YlaD
MRDCIDVDCETSREAISARLDGEAAPVSEDQLARHLAECTGCRAWEQRAGDLSRALRVRPVERSPDLVGAVVRAHESQRGRVLQRWPRILLGCVALCQVALGISQVLSSHGSAAHPVGGMPTAGHLFNESTAWNIALGLGLLWCAFRVRATAGVVPVLSAFLAVLTGFCVVDFINAAVSAGRLASHGLLVLGLVLLVVVQRDRGRGWPRPGRAHAADDGAPPNASDARIGEPVDNPRRDGRGHLPPTGFRETG